MVLASLPTSRIELTPIQVVTVDGSPQNALTVTTQHGVNRPKGTATFTLQRPETSVDELRDRWLNRPIEAQIGYQETGGARRVFSGRVASISRSFDNRGYGLQVRAVGWASLLDFESEEDIVFAGRTSLYDIVRSLCQMNGLPMYGGDLITYPDSTEVVRLGGIPFVDDGNVIIPRRTSPLRWITQKLGLFGYRAYDRPDGMFWWQRVNGAPAGEAVQSFAQGLSLLSASRDDDTDGMVTWWDVEGASWTDDDGISIKIRSFPAVVPDDDGGFVTPPGYVRQSLSDPALVSQDLADAVRNAHELDTLGPYETETWRYVGNTEIQPGDVAAITSDLLELSAAKRWVMAVDNAASSRGIRTTWQGWTGPGEALAAGDDSETISVFTSPRHIGDEYVAWYAQPAPQGKVISFDISIPDTYTALILEGWAHGCSSQMIGNTNTEIEVSKIEVWQGGDKAVGTATLPTMPEDYALQLPYGSGTAHWQRFRIPVPGRLTPGVATVKLIAGENSNSGTDDYEIQQLNLVTSGNGYPVLPTGGS